MMSEVVGRCVFCKTKMPVQLDLEGEVLKLVYICRKCEPREGLLVINPDSGKYIRLSEEELEKYPETTIPRHRVAIVEDDFRFRGICEALMTEEDLKYIRETKESICQYREMWASYMEEAADAKSHIEDLTKELEESYDYRVCKLPEVKA